MQGAGAPALASAGTSGNPWPASWEGDHTEARAKLPATEQRFCTDSFCVFPFFRRVTGTRCSCRRGAGPSPVRWRRRAGAGSLNNIKELKGIRSQPRGGWRIGALTTLTEIAEHPQIRASYPVLTEAAASVATPQLRNQGTLGGNLCQRPRCWYFRGQFQCRRKGGDTCFAEAGQSQYHGIFGASQCYIVHPSDTAPALVALDAKVNILGRRGTRLVPISSFFVLPKDS